MAMMSPGHASLSSPVAPRALASPVVAASPPAYGSAAAHGDTSSDGDESAGSAGRVGVGGSEHGGGSGGAHEGVAGESLLQQHQRARAEEAVSALSSPDISDPDDSDEEAEEREEAEHTQQVLGKAYANVFDRYHMGAELGRGQYGVIWLATERATGETLACKSICKAKLEGDGDVEDVRREVAVMQAVRGHAAIVELRGTFEDRQWVHVLMDVCLGGELYQRILQRQRYPESDAAVVCHTLLSVVAHLNALGLMHRDLKPENILLVSPDSHTDVKIADFGLATFVQPGAALSAMAGSAFYIAPEVLAAQYGVEADMWSVGVVLFILLSGLPPFWAPSEDGIFQAIAAGHVDMSAGVWEGVSADAKDLVSRMLTLDPRHRITPLQALNHRWLKEHCGNLTSVPPSLPATSTSAASTTELTPNPPGGDKSELMELLQQQMNMKSRGRVGKKKGKASDARAATAAASASGNSGASAGGREGAGGAGGVGLMTKRSSVARLVFEEMLTEVAAGRGRRGAVASSRQKGAGAPGSGSGGGGGGGSSSSIARSRSSDVSALMGFAKSPHADPLGLPVPAGALLRGRRTLSRRFEREEEEEEEGGVDDEDDGRRAAEDDGETDGTGQRKVGEGVGEGRSERSPKLSPARHSPLALATARVGEGSREASREAWRVEREGSRRVEKGELMQLLASVEVHMAAATADVPAAAPHTPAAAAAAAGQVGKGTVPRVSSADDVTGKAKAGGKAGEGDARQGVGRGATARATPPLPVGRAKTDVGSTVLAVTPAPAAATVATDAAAAVAAAPGTGSAASSVRGLGVGAGTSAGGGGGGAASGSSSGRLLRHRSEVVGLMRGGPDADRGAPTGAAAGAGGGADAGGRRPGRKTMSELLSALNDLDGMAAGSAALGGTPGSKGVGGREARSSGDKEKEQGGEQGGDSGAVSGEEPEARRGGEGQADNVVHAAQESGEDGEMEAWEWEEKERIRVQEEREQETQRPLEAFSTAAAEATATAAAAMARGMADPSAAAGSAPTAPWRRLVSLPIYASPSNPTSAAPPQWGSDSNAAMAPASPLLGAPGPAAHAHAALALTDGDSAAGFATPLGGSRGQQRVALRSLSTHALRSSYAAGLSTPPPAVPAAAAGASWNADGTVSPGLAGEWAKGGSSRGQGRTVGDYAGRAATTPLVAPVSGGKGPMGKGKWVAGAGGAGASAARGGVAAGAGEAGEEGNGARESEERLRSPRLDAGAPFSPAATPTWGAARARFPPSATEPAPMFDQSQPFASPQPSPMPVSPHHHTAAFPHAFPVHPDFHSPMPARHGPTPSFPKSPRGEPRLKSSVSFGGGVGPPTGSGAAALPGGHMRSPLHRTASATAAAAPPSSLAAARAPGSITLAKPYNPPPSAAAAGIAVAGSYDSYGSGTGLIPDDQAFCRPLYPAPDSAFPLSPLHPHHHPHHDYNHGGYHLPADPGSGAGEGGGYAMGYAAENVSSYRSFHRGQATGHMGQGGVRSSLGHSRSMQQYEAMPSGDMYASGDAVDEYEGEQQYMAGRAGEYGNGQQWEGEGSGYLSRRYSFENGQGTLSVGASVDGAWMYNTGEGHGVARRRDRDRLDKGGRREREVRGVRELQRAAEVPCMPVGAASGTRGSGIVGVGGSGSERVRSERRKQLLRQRSQDAPVAAALVMGAGRGGRMSGESEVHAARSISLNTVKAAMSRDTSAGSADSASPLESPCVSWAEDEGMEAGDGMGEGIALVMRREGMLPMQGARGQQGEMDSEGSGRRGGERPSGSEWEESMEGSDDEAVQGEEEEEDVYSERSDGAGSSSGSEAAWGRDEVESDGGARVGTDVLVGMLRERSVSISDLDNSGNEEGSDGWSASDGEGVDAELWEGERESKRERDSDRAKCNGDRVREDDTDWDDDRDRYRERDRDKERARPRDRDRDGARDKEQGRNRDPERGREDREKERYRSRESEKPKSKHRDRSRERDSRHCDSSSRHREKRGSKSRDTYSEQDRHREHGKERARERERARDGKHGRGSERERDRHERTRESGRERSKERHGHKDRERSSDRERSHERDEARRKEKRKERDQQSRRKDPEQAREGGGDRERRRERDGGKTRERRQERYEEREWEEEREGKWDKEDDRERSRGSKAEAQSMVEDGGGRGKGRDKEREKNRDKEKGREKDRERGKERDRDRDKERERDKGRDRDKERDRDRDKERDRDRDKDRDRDRDREREKERDRDSERNREKGRESSKHKGERTRERDRDREERDRDRYKDGKDKEKSRDKAKRLEKGKEQNRDREKGGRSYKEK
ncbi:unnamed protein product [Closterium sp. Naga37s-1]|nr:unnamed protein product [Closterium sp. Naga37s-1]